jgi:hypothetical protein
MDEELSETIDKTENVDRIYIASDEKGLLFTTDESTPGYDVITLAEGGNTVKRGELVCAFELTNNSRLITLGDISYKRPIWIAYYKYLAFVSFAGFLVSSGVMILVWRHMKNRKWAYRILTSILLAWIIIISGYVGYSAYKEYNSSIIGMENKIEKAIKSDVDTLHRMGIRDENISGMDEYLLRYSNNIPEIEAITYNGTGYDFTISSSYMNRVAVDYLLQTLLFFAFSSMILTEHNLFMSGIGMNNWEEDENG